jgi:hypothetical protein
VTTEVVQLRGQRPVSRNTFGAGSESNITALEALLSEVRRTHAHILWLEAYIARLPEWAIFEETVAVWQDDDELTRVAAVTAQPGTLKYQIQVERQRKMRGQTTKPSVHPAIKTLQAERGLLISACAQAIRAGVALDQIELAKQQGTLLVEAMTSFATELGHDINDANVIQLMTVALDSVMRKAEQMGAGA